MSVTSSGRSSTSRHMRCTSGLLALMEAAMSFRMVVLPALGGLTISPRWPLPIGLTRSMTRAVTVCLPCSMIRHSSGYTGVRSPKRTRAPSWSTGVPFTDVTFWMAAYFSFSRAGRVWPHTRSPLRRPLRRMVDSPT